MSNLGYFNIPRELLFDPIFKGLSYEYRHIFLTILAHIAHKPMKLDDHGVLIELNPGQMMTTLRDLERLCNEKGIDKSKIERALRKFFSVGFSRQETRHTKTIITITEPNICKLIESQNETRFETTSRQDRDKIETESKRTKEIKEKEGTTTTSSHSVAVSAVVVPLNFENGEIATNDDIGGGEDQKPKALNAGNLENLTSDNIYYAQNKQHTPKKQSLICQINSLAKPLYDCLNSISLSPDEKLSLMQFPEERVSLAVKYATNPRTVIKKTLISALIWHCKQKTPPNPEPEILTPQQQLALNYISDLKKEGVTNIYEEENALAIPNHYMFIWLGGKTQISLKNSPEMIKSDLIQSKREMLGRAIKVK